jgi:2-(1,2-epoxy-1,2-dihydrophenyl)acetyl-CoA isomerase
VPDKTVLLAKKDMIATITLNRPEQNNAFDFPMMEAIDNAINDVASDKGVRVVIITGAGKAFCTGADVAYLMSLGETHALHQTTMEEMMRGDNNILTTVLKIRNLPKPVIAAVNGTAAGGGLALALACDIRIASDKARFSEVFIRRGLIPVGGGTFFLPRLIGIDKACKLIWTGEMVEKELVERVRLIIDPILIDAGMVLNEGGDGRIRRNVPDAPGIVLNPFQNRAVPSNLLRRHPAT